MKLRHGRRRPADVDPESPSSFLGARPATSPEEAWPRRYHRQFPITARSRNRRHPDPRGAEIRVNRHPEFSAPGDPAPRPRRRSPEVRSICRAPWSSSPRRASPASSSPNMGRRTGSSAWWDRCSSRCSPARHQTEYNLGVRFEGAPYVDARWGGRPTTPAELKALPRPPTPPRRPRTTNGVPVYLARNKLGTSRPRSRNGPSSASPPRERAQLRYPR